MLKQLQVRNFRSLSDATFEPRAIELIIGPNGSGKTALCKVMQFVGLCGTKVFDKRLDAITLCEPSENGSRIEKADPEWLKTVLRKFDLGEAYFRGLMRRPDTKGAIN